MFSQQQAWRKFHHFASNLSISLPRSAAGMGDVA
jgi:hypothetical protein